MTAILLNLLESNSIDAALVTAFPHDGSLRPKVLLARSREEILSARGSKYCPVALDAAFREVGIGQRVAVVGLPCHLHGLRRLEAAFPWIEASVRCRIGLFCDRTLLFSAIDLLAGDARLKMESLSGIDYRSAQRNGWPGEVCFITRSGQRVFMSPPGRVHNVADWATPPRCRVCFDKTNVLADLSIGDPWGISQSREGESAVVVRTSEGAAILEVAKAEGSLSLRPVAAEDVFLSQGVDTRAENYLAYREAWSGTGLALPEYSGIGGFAGRRPTDAASKKARSALASDFRIASATTLRGALAWMRVVRGLSRLRRAISRRIRRSRG